MTAALIQSLFSTFIGNLLSGALIIGCYLLGRYVGVRVSGGFYRDGR